MQQSPLELLSRCSASGDARRREAAFTLVELVIVILVISILVAIAAPRVVNISQKARINATLVEARKFQEAAMIFLNKNGRYPNDASNGVFPPDFVGYFPRYDFDREPALGGTWDWNGPGTSLPHFGISVCVPSTDTATIAQFQAVDNQADDGNLNTGSIQRVVRTNWTFLQFVLETR